MPTFPLLNGQVKCPLRWYSDIRLASWKCFPCKEGWDQSPNGEGDAPYALVSPLTTLPPFQFWRTPSSATITSWKTYGLDDVQISDLTGYAGSIVKVPLLDEDRYVYAGNTNLGVLSKVKQYSVIIFSDGVEQTSELFLPTCDVGSEDQYLDHDFRTLGAPQFGVGSSGNEADATKTNAGDPADPFPFEGKKTLGLNDGKLYTYTSGAWVQSTPTPGNYRYVKNTQQWWQFTLLDGWGLMGNPGFDDPPFVISGDGVCFVNNPDGLGLTLDNGHGVDLQSIVTEDTPVTVRICVGPWNGAPISVTVGDTTFPLPDAAGGCFVFNAIYPAGSTQYIAISPGPAFDGCIQSAEIVKASSATSCNLVLSWTNCGNVGTMYYEGGFVNKFFLPMETEVIRPTAGVGIEASKGGLRETTQNFFRKEVEWHLPIGLVPWHVADALTELAAHDTITLTHKMGLGTDVIVQVRVEQNWENEDDACLTNVDVFFQVLDASVATGCCEVFQPPCDPSKGPGGITSIECYEGDCANGYVVQADITAGHRGQLERSSDGGATWENTDLDLTAAQWTANDIPVEAGGASFRIRTYFADCELGHTAVFSLECPGGFIFAFSDDDSATDPGDGLFAMNDSDPSGANKLVLDLLDEDGVDRTTWLDGGTGQAFLVRLGVGTPNTLVFNIDSVSGASGFRLWNVTYVSGNAPTSGDRYCISYGH